MTWQVYLGSFGASELWNGVCGQQKKCFLSKVVSSTFICSIYLVADGETFEMLLRINACKVLMSRRRLLPYTRQPARLDEHRMCDNFVLRSVLTSLELFVNVRVE